MEVKIKAMNKTEIARYYEISVYRLNIWLIPFAAKIGAYNGKMYTPKQVRIIFECLG